jgi:hypothetical protein
MAKVKPLEHARKIKDVLAHYPAWREETIFRTTNSHKWVVGTTPDGVSHKIRLGGKHSEDRVEREQAEFLRQQIKKCSDGKCDCKQNSERDEARKVEPSEKKSKKKKRK